MRRLSTSFLDLFLLLLMSVVVMVKPVSEDAPEELTQLVVTVTWDAIDTDVDLWGRRCGVPNTTCGYKAREVSNLRLHGDWTMSTARQQGKINFALETMTIDSLISGEYGFALWGYGLNGEDVPAKVTVASVKPYRLLIDKEVIVKHHGWTTIGRVTLDEEGKVTAVDEELEVTFD